MSYAPPSQAAQHMPRPDAHPRHVPSASTQHAQSTKTALLYDKSYIEGLVSNDYASLPGSSHSQASHPIFRPNNPNGLHVHPSAPVPSSYPTAQFPPTPVTPTGPSPAPGFNVAPGPGFTHRSSSEQAVNAILSHELVNAMVATCDKNVQARLSTFESSMQGYIENQARTNSLIIGTVNTKLAEEKASLAKKLDDLMLDIEQKRRLATQNLYNSLEDWQTTMADTTKAAIKEVVEKAVNVVPRIDEKLLEQINAVGRLTLASEAKASTQRSVIASDINLLHTMHGRMQSQVDSIEARTRSIEKTLSSAISSIASLSSTFSIPMASSAALPSTSVTSALTIAPTVRQSLNSAGAVVSVVTPELLTSSADSLREHITECTSQTQETLAQFAKTTTVARDEEHEGKADLAGMLEKSHELQTVQINAVLNEISSLKAAVGVVDPMQLSSEEHAVNAESMTMGTTEVSVSQTPISLADRMRVVEENQRLLMQYFKNTALLEQALPREVSLGPNDSASSCCTDNAESHVSNSVFDAREQMTNEFNHILRYLLANIELKPDQDQDRSGLVKQETKLQMKAEPTKSLHRGSRLRCSKVKNLASSSKANLRDTRSSKQVDEHAQKSNESGPQTQDQPMDPVVAASHGDSVAFTDSPPALPSLPNIAIPTSTTSGSLSHPRSMRTAEALPVAQNSTTNMAQERPPDNHRLSLTEVGENRDGAIDEEFPTGEELLSPHSKRYRQDEREDSPLTQLWSDSDDEYVPSSSSRSHLPRSSEAGPSRRKSTENSRKGKIELVCPRPSCRRTFKHIVNLNQHKALRACPDLRAARMKKSPIQGTEGSQVPSSATDTSHPPPTKKQKLGKSKHDATITLSVCTWPEKSKEDDVFDRQLIQCDTCSNFYHFRCVGVKKGDHVIQNANEPFICSPCSSLSAGNVRAGSRKLDPQPRCGRPDCDWRNAQDIFVVDKILGRALSDPGDGAPYYFWLVKWEGYPASMCRWEKAEQIGDSEKLIKDFYDAATKERFNCHSNELIILKEAIEGGYRIQGV